MIIHSYAERLEALPYAQRIICISARETVSLGACHRLIDLYERRDNEPARLQQTADNRKSK